MSVPYYHLVGHIVAAHHAAHHATAAVSALKKAGFSSKKLEEAAPLAEKAEALVEDFLEAKAADRIVEHEVHVAAGEIEMWMQTVEFLLSRKLEEKESKAALAADLHGPTHLTTVVAQALHLIAMMRVDENVIEAIGGERKVRDVGTRGWALLKRLYSSTRTRLEGHGDAIDSHRETMADWVAELDVATSTFSESDYPHLGRIGYVPEGVGIPVGGTAYGVVLHERGQGKIPNPTDRKPASGWSIGRQGNRENLGKGWS